MKIINVFLIGILTLATGVVLAQSTGKKPELPEQASEKAKKKWEIKHEIYL